MKIYQHYGPGMYSVIQENPYQLADDIQGVGFKIADEIAAKVGIFTDSDYRIRSGLFYACSRRRETAIHICRRRSCLPMRRHS